MKITDCHCPSSVRRPWDLDTRDAVLPNVFRLAGLVRFKDWGGGAEEPIAWILGGDLNLDENAIHNRMKTPAWQKVSNAWFRRLTLEV